MTIITHNPWTIYRLNADGSEAAEAVAEHSRPQNWGQPDTWMYRVYALQCTIRGRTYRNYAHCWAELPITEAEHLELFAPLIAQIMFPSTPVQRCADTHLVVDDFWATDWGPLPPLYDGSDDDEMDAPDDEPDSDWDDEANRMLRHE